MHSTSKLESLDRSAQLGAIYTRLLVGKMVASGCVKILHQALLWKSQQAEKEPGKEAKVGLREDLLSTSALR